MIDQGKNEIKSYMERLRSSGLPTSLFTRRSRRILAIHQFALVSEIKLVMTKMNSAIRNFRSYSAATQEAFFRNVKYDLSKARARCERKYGRYNCIQMNKVSYCLNCGSGYEIYWSSVDKCGCKRVFTSLTNPDYKKGGSVGSLGTLFRRRMRLLPSADVYHVGTYSGNNWVHKESVNEAFFYEAQDN